MAGSSRHLFIVPPGSDSTPLPVQLGSEVCYGIGNPGIWQTLEDGLVHRLLREPVRTSGSQRPELGAVADQCERPSVGERLAAHPFLALLSRCRLSDLRRRTRLEPVDDSRPLRSVK